MKKLLVTIIASLFSLCSLYSQNKTVTGRVITDLFDIGIFVSIRIDDTVKVGSTDMNGYFQIEIPISVKKIKFDGLGLCPVIIELTDKCDKVELVMMAAFHYNMTIKRANRKRKRRFKKFPEIYRRAFEVGIFETETPCYNREFEC